MVLLCQLRRFLAGAEIGELVSGTNPGFVEACEGMSETRREREEETEGRRTVEFGERREI